MKRNFISIAFASLILIITFSCGSTRAGQGARSGAAIGAGVGLLIGALRGDADAALTGLAVGAAVGAGQGAYEGWRQDQDDERTRQITDAIRESNQTTTSNADPSLRKREELTRFLGVWTLEGWAQEVGEQRYEVKGKVNGNVQMNYFVELAYVDLNVTGFDSQIWGTSLLGYDQEQGYSIVTRLSTLPEPVHMAGQFNPSSRTFTFEDVEARVLIKFENPDRFTVETTIKISGSDQVVESYRFTRS